MGTVQELQGQESPVQTSKVKSLILYSLRTNSPRFPGKEYYTLAFVNKCNLIWVRSECVEEDTKTALSMAKPRDGEIVLNTIPLVCPD